MRRSSTVLTVVVAAALGLTAAAFITQWVVIDVHPSGHGAFKVPIPLTLIRATTALIPGSAYEHAAVPREVAARRRPVLTVIAALRNSPDATFVDMHNKDADISIAKRGMLLLINVDSHNDSTTVRCRIPLNGLHEALERWDWKTIDPSPFLDIFAEAPRGPLLEVAAPDATVAVTIW